VGVEGRVGKEREIALLLLKSSVTFYKEMKLYEISIFQIDLQNEI